MILILNHCENWSVIITVCSYGTVPFGWIPDQSPGMTLHLTQNIYHP